MGENFGVFLFPKGKSKKFDHVQTNENYEKGFYDCNKCKTRGLVINFPPREETSTLILLVNLAHIVFQKRRVPPTKEGGDFAYWWNLPGIRSLRWSDPSRRKLKSVHWWHKCLQLSVTENLGYNFNSFFFHQFNLHSSSRIFSVSDQNF